MVTEIRAVAVGVIPQKGENFIDFQIVIHLLGKNLFLMCEILERFFNFPQIWSNPPNSPQNLEKFGVAGSS